jgi:hypothetical protein
MVSERKLPGIDACKLPFDRVGRGNSGYPGCGCCRTVVYERGRRCPNLESAILTDMVTGESGRDEKKESPQVPAGTGAVAGGVRGVDVRALVLWRAVTIMTPATHETGD